MMNLRNHQNVNERSDGEVVEVQNEHAVLGSEWKTVPRWVHQKQNQYLNHLLRRGQNHKVQVQYAVEVQRKVASETRIVIHRKRVVVGVDEHRNLAMIEEEAMMKEDGEV